MHSTAPFQTKKPKAILSFGCYNETLLLAATKIEATIGFSLLSNPATEHRQKEWIQATDPFFGVRHSFVNSR